MNSPNQSTRDLIFYNDSTAPDSITINNAQSPPTRNTQALGEQPPTPMIHNPDGAPDSNPAYTPLDKVSHIPNSEFLDVDIQYKMTMSNTLKRKTIRYISLKTRTLLSQMDWTCREDFGTRTPQGSSCSNVPN